MSKKMTVEDALKLYREKKDSGLKTSWGIFKKRLTTKDYSTFRDKVEDLYGDSED